MFGCSVQQQRDRATYAPDLATLVYLLISDVYIGPVTAIVRALFGLVDA